MDKFVQEFAAHSSINQLNKIAKLLKCNISDFFVY